MALVISGINHTTAPVQIREQLSFDDDLAKQADRQLIQTGILQEAVLISTCNRTEIYGVVDDTDRLNGQIPAYIADVKLAGQTLPEKLFYQKYNQHAAEHLFRVAAGLDSMVVGEVQILGQIKHAYSLASEASTTGKVLNKLFHSAFRLGKRVRSETKIGEGSVSIASAGVDLARKIFLDLSDKKVLLIGAGEMAVNTLANLNKHGIRNIYICNRTFKKAETLAEKCGGSAIPYASMEQALAEVDMIIASTAAKRPILMPEQIKQIMMRRKNKNMFLIDIAVPRNIHPDVRDIYNAYLYDMDDLQKIVAQNLGARKTEIPKAEKIVTEEIAALMEWYNQLPQFTAIQLIQEHFDLLRRNEIRRNRKFFKQEDWEPMDKFSKSLMKKFLKSPILQIKTCKKSDGERGHCTVMDIFGLEDAWEKKE